jgi:hypothetical protein
VNLFRTGVSLALVAAGLAAVPGLQAQASTAATKAEPSVVQRMQAEASGAVRLKTESTTGKVGFVRAVGQGDLMPSAKATSPASAASKADAYLDKYAAAFGATGDQLVPSGVTATEYGAEAHDAGAVDYHAYGLRRALRTGSNDRDDEQTDDRQNHATTPAQHHAHANTVAPTMLPRKRGHRVLSIRGGSPAAPRTATSTPGEPCRLSRPHQRWQ